MVKKLLAAITISLTLLGLVTIPQVAAQGDCDDNAVIRCGATAATLSQKCQENQAGNVQALYRYFGIANCDAALSGLAAGQVGNDNKVYVNGQVVATNAITAGRQNMPGSTPILGGAFYERPPSVSFRSARLDALVRMENGVFKYAIILSCGNPVKATPATTPPPSPPAPQKHPALTISKKVSQAVVPLNQDFDYTVAIQNTGDTALTNATVADNAPAGVMFVNNTQGSTTQFRTTLAKLDVNATQTFTIHARITQQIKEAVVNTACVATTELSNQNCATAQNQLACDTNPALPLNSPDCKPVTPVVTVSTPPTPQPQSQPQVLANTGAADVLGLGSSVSIAGYAGNLIYRRLRQKFLGF